MSALTASRFAEFYQAVHGKGRSPFPWQARLAARVCQGDWPRVIALPTAAGKTTCVEIALFALAVQAGRVDRTAPRRIFFVVDRRVIVAQAYEHARHVADKLSNPDAPILREVAERLCRLAGSGRPLDCFQLRGGIYRDDAWARSPLQPTVIASTVDQVGSRLLYRGYGLRSGLAWPIHAALAANDSLILLDEAHCARPFGQTVGAVCRYRGWAADPIPSPFQFVQMTATPHEDVPADAIVRDEDDDRSHPVLGPRIAASKPTRLVVAEKAKGKGGRKHLVDELVRQARGLMTGAVRAVGVIVNRVATVREVYRELRKGKPSAGADVVLLIGRMRPLDRDRVVSQQLGPLLSGATAPLPRPLYVVATQCLEVGADLDFHALVSECASLDALRQRFGRLNRVAACDFAPGVIVVRADQTAPAAKPADVDPVYGQSLSHTWGWLTEQAPGGTIDVGVASLREHLQGVDADQLAAMDAPSADAPVLLPSHLDAWVQTTPRPAPDPDPAVFLHGPGRGAPDVQVVWRADLPDGSEEEWAEVVSLCPPSSSEAMTVPLLVFRDWLRGKEGDESSDVEGERLAEQEAGPVVRKALRWCGPDDERTEVIEKAEEVRPGDLLILPASAGGWDELGHVPESEGDRIDRGEEAYLLSRDVPLLRLTREVTEQWPAELRPESLTALQKSEEATEDDKERDRLLADVLGDLAAKEVGPEFGHVVRIAKALASAKKSVEAHPGGGWVVRGKGRLTQRPVSSFSDEDDLASCLDSESKDEVTLGKHCEGVEAVARRFAGGCGLPERFVETVAWAARWHDLGKADRRFQALLRNLPRWAVRDADALWAKSVRMPRSVQARRRAREQSGYPAGARHEMLSVRLAEARLERLPAGVDRELLLHLIASHHGHARPLVPIVDEGDEAVPAFTHLGESFGAGSTATGLERLDSGVAERFWSLVRRHGWWGLAYLEAIVRLADHRRSEDEQNEGGGRGD